MCSGGLSCTCTCSQASAVKLRIQAVESNTTSRSARRGRTLLRMSWITALSCPCARESADAPKPAAEDTRRPSTAPPRPESLSDIGHSAHTLPWGETSAGRRSRTLREASVVLPQPDDVRLAGVGTELHLHDHQLLVVCVGDPVLRPLRHV